MSPSRLRGLDAAHILATIRWVKRRIDTRFPTSGIGNIWQKIMILERMAVGS